jgi:hypothetical protein
MTKLANFSLALLAAFVNFVEPAFAQAPSAPMYPFEYRQKDAPFEISRLTCDQFHKMLLKKDPGIFLVTIWAHGMVAGMDGAIAPFDKSQAVGIPLFVEAVCKGASSSTVFDRVKNYESELRAKK